MAIWFFLNFMSDFWILGYPKGGGSSEICCGRRLGACIGTFTNVFLDAWLAAMDYRSNLE